MTRRQQYARPTPPRHHPATPTSPAGPPLPLTPAPPGSARNPVSPAHAVPTAAGRTLAAWPRTADHCCVPGCSGPPRGAATPAACPRPAPPDPHPAGCYRR